MRTDRMEESRNVEDRRHGGGGPIVFGGIGVLVLALVVMLLGGNPLQVLQSAPTSGQQEQYQPSPQEEERRELVAKTLGSTEKIWRKILAQYNGPQYRDPKLVFFSGRTQSACGFASAATGPFYCPPEEKVYIDLNFFTVMSRRLGAPGDFAQAYVVAHEIGHHVQKILGYTQTFDRQRMSYRRQGREDLANALSVRLELQADFLAGVWAHHAQLMDSILEKGDVEEALNAAVHIGDDTLQAESRGSVRPDSFTHGTSKQRATWFLHGFKTGDRQAGNTFDDEVFYRVTPRGT